MEFYWKLLTEIQKGVEEILGPSSAFILLTHGAERLTDDILEKIPEEAKTPPIDWITIEKNLKELELGIFRFDIDEETSSGKVIVFESTITRTYGKSNHPICYITAGILRGLLTKLLGSPVYIKEELCSSMGGDKCVFTVKRALPV